MRLSLAELLSAGRPTEHPVAWVGNGQLSRQIDWSEFQARVAKLSRVLVARPERSWLLACAEPFEFAVALFAVWHAGCRAMLPPSLREGAIIEVSDQADGILDDLNAIPVENNAAGNIALASLDPALCMLDLFTSGSSGNPKRVTKSLAQLDAEVATLERLWGDDARGPVLATVPHHHIYGLLFRLLWPLSSGRSFDSLTCTVPEILLERLERFVALGPSRVISSPSQLTRMPELVPLEALAGNTERIFSSGGPLSSDTALRFQAALGEPPLEILGSTETGGIAWREQRNDDAWTPFPDVSVSVSEAGALTLVSPYLPNTEPLTTDDAATKLEDGRFRLHGRLDRIVKIEEKRLSLPDMEARLADHPWVREAALVVLGGRRQILGALLVLDETGRQALADNGRASFAKALRHYLSHWFDAVLLPRKWRYCEALPYNERGKLAFADLSAQFKSIDAREESLPMIDAETTSGNECVTLHLFVPANLSLFAGHFPGLPLLPGIAQIDWASRLGSERFAIADGFSRLLNIKFQKPVLPDCKLDLVLNWDAGRRQLAFSYVSAAGCHTSGKIEFSGKGGNP